MLTIITRTYGQRSGLLRMAAASVMAQTYRPIEWLVVEDGPGDAAATLASLPPVEGITVRHLQNPRLGRSAAANRGIDEATGRYLCFFDDDDDLYPEHSAVLIGLLKRYPLAAGAYAASICASVEGSGTARTVTKEEVHLTPCASSALLLRTNPFPIQAIIFRRSAVYQQRFDTNLDALEDWLFWTEIFLEKKLVWTPEITSRYYVPADPVQLERRRQAHIDAEGEYRLQMEGFLAERAMFRYGEIIQHHNNQLCRWVDAAGGPHPPHALRHAG